MATHGKNARLAVGGYDMSQIANMGRQQFQKELAPADTFSMEDHVFEPGQKSGTLTMQAVHRGNLAETEYLLNDMEDNLDTNPHIVFGPVGFATGAPVYISESFHVSLEAGGDNKSVVTTNCSFEAEGGVRPATLLVSPYA